jgi:glycosyltransferase domain-containing protein
MQYVASILIPTFNRPEHLRRLMRYYASFGDRSCQFIIADSSRSEIKQENSKSVSEVLSRISCLYLEYSYDCQFQEKLLDAISRAEAEFLAICADDDFLILPTVIQGAHYLSQNPDYSITHGWAYTIFLDSPKNATGKIVDFKPYPQCSHESESGIERLYNHMSEYSTTWGSLHRTKLIAQNLKGALNYPSDYNFMELGASGLDVIQGKVKRFDAIHLVRQSDAPEKTYIPPWYRADGWLRAHSSVLKAWATALSINEPIPMIGARIAALSAMQAYLAPFHETYINSILTEDARKLEISKTKFNYRLLRLGRILFLRKYRKIWNNINFGSVTSLTSAEQRFNLHDVYQADFAAIRAQIELSDLKE